MYELNDKVAVVTGASRGIGAAIALKLAQAGAKVLLVSRTLPAEEVNADFEKNGLSYKHFTADLSRVENVTPVVEATLANFGRLDILVNNAGIIRRAPVLEYRVEDWDAVLDTNLKVPFFLAQACARQMVSQGQGGKIINICSLLSFQGGILVPAYTAAKHGLAGVTKSLANELAAKKINVNGIAPGYIRTDNTAALQADPDRSSAIVSRVPQGDWGQPDDIAGAALFLAGPLSDFIHGHIMAVDGGWMGR
jgi:2-deoxy-D-gluconate 3-dehydrogenase